MLKSYLMGIVCLFASVNAFGKSVVMVCPASSSITVSKQPYSEPWRAYEYEAIIPVPGLSAFGDQLPMWGQGNDTVLKQMTVATWTDSVFLCWYQAEYGEELVNSNVNLYGVFDSCTFPTATGGSHSECYASDPASCPLVCEL